MSEIAQIKIEAPPETTMDEIEYEAVRRVLPQCDNDPNRAARILKRSPQQVKAILAKRALDLLEKMKVET